MNLKYKDQEQVIDHLKARPVTDETRAQIIKEFKESEVYKSLIERIPAERDFRWSECLDNFQKLTGMGVSHFTMERTRAAHIPHIPQIEIQDEELTKEQAKGPAEEHDENERSTVEGVVHPEAP